MTDASGSPEAPSGRTPKVARLLEEYGLGALGEELERRWTADGAERMSLRELADHFNRELLAAAMAEAGMRPLSGEVANVYRLLTGEDTNEAERTRARRRLEGEGVDVDALEQDFVTYQAVRTYLRNYRGAEYSTDDRPGSATEAETIRRLRGRTVSVTADKLDALCRAGELSLGNFRVFANVSVFCEDCERQYDIDELLERGGCECGDSPG